MAHGKNWKNWPTDIPGYLLPYMDPYHFATTQIDELHRLIHDGMVFHASDKLTGLANGATVDMLLRVPAGLYPHLNRVLLSFGGGDIDILYYEAPTTSAPGTEITEKRNTNRNSSNTASLELYSGPTVTDVGERLGTIWVPPTAGGIGAQAGVADVSPNEEWVLKTGTDYLLRITNNSGGTINWRYEFLWYELSYLQANA